LTTHRYFDGVRNVAWPQLTNRLCQRNYYEHITRDGVDYQSIYEHTLWRGYPRDHCVIKM